MVKVKKRNGRYEDFIESKIVTAVQKAGASAEEAKHVADEVYGKVAPSPEVSADDLSNMVVDSLGKVNKAAAANFAKFRDVKLLLALWNMPVKDAYWPPTAEKLVMERSTELEDLFVRTCKAISSGELRTVMSHFSQNDGVLAIGTDPNEWWTDNATIDRVFKTQMEEMRGTQFIASENPRAYRNGNVGWLADRPKLILPNRMGNMEIPCRATAVFLKEDEGWKIVQWHISIGVPNEGKVTT